ncbi:hypothetical protein D3C83_131360 [compost metagenome]
MTITSLARPPATYRDFWSWLSMTSMGFALSSSNRATPSGLKVSMLIFETSPAISEVA